MTSPAALPVHPSPGLLAGVARRFWWPIYGAIRDRGVEPAIAAPLTGSVLARLAKGSPFLRHEDHDGRLRLLLLAELDAVLKSPHMVAAGVSDSLVDVAAAEARDEYGTGESAAERFRRRWAVLVLELALGQMRLQAEQSGNLTRFDQLAPFLACRVPDGQATDIVDAVDAVGVENLRDQFRTQVRRVVSETVTTPMRLEAELIALFG